MNRYIRTKDGKIYDTATEWKNIRETHSLIVLMNKDRKNVLIYKADTKQADAIEDLCDEFVLVDEEINHYTVIRKEALVLFKPTPTWALYGAIWTDKGLIHKAKMNGKGEFKLL